MWTKRLTFCRHSQNKFSWIRIILFWSKCQWGLLTDLIDIWIKIQVPRVQLPRSQHWFRWWLGAKQAKSQYLNQWWLGWKQISLLCSILNSHCPGQLSTYPAQNLLALVSGQVIVSLTVLVQSGNKRLIEPMLTQISVPIWRLKATKS